VSDLILTSVSDLFVTSVLDQPCQILLLHLF